MKITFGIKSAADCVTAIAALTVIRDGFPVETAEIGPVVMSDDAIAASAEGLTAPAPTPAPEVPAETDPRGGVELDANGTPWIEGIHAGTKTKKADGTWKKGRGVDDETLKAAEADARAKLAATPTPTLPTSDAEPVAAPVEELPPVTLDDLSAVYMMAVEKQIIAPESVTDLYIKHGCQEIDDIATNETARRGVRDELQALIDAADAAPATPTMPGM